MNIYELREKKLRRWFSMWLDRQDRGIGKLFALDAVYIESWGSEYHGVDKIKLWFDEWNSPSRSGLRPPRGCCKKRRSAGASA